MANVLTFGVTITEHWRNRCDTSIPQPTILIFCYEFDPFESQDQSCRLPLNDYSLAVLSSNGRIYRYSRDPRTRCTPRNAIFPGDSRRVRTTIGAGGLFASGEYVRGWEAPRRAIHATGITSHLSTAESKIGPTGSREPVIPTFLFKRTDLWVNYQPSTENSNLAPLGEEALFLSFTRPVSLFYEINFYMDQCHTRVYFLEWCRRWNYDWNLKLPSETLR